MTYDIFTFKKFVEKQDELNHLKHKLKQAPSDEEREELNKNISSSTGEVMDHLAKLHRVPVQEDGVVAAAPTNVQSSGAIAGTGGAGGEPGVRKRKNPILMKLLARKSPK